MRLLIVTNVAAPYRLPLWSAIKDRGVDLTVALLEPEIAAGFGMPEERARDWQAAGQQGASHTVGLRTWRFTRGEDTHYIARSGVLQAVRAADAVILCGWDSPAFWQFLGACKLTRTPVLGFYESTLATSSFTEGPIASARTFFMRQLDGVVVPGVAAEESVLDKGVAKDRVWRGFNSVDMTGFAAVNTPTDAGARDFLFVGKLIARKNVDSILEAFATLPDDCHLSLAGSGAEDAALRAQAEELGISDRVTFLGYTDYADLPAVMARHGHLLLVSRVEVWGLTVNEGLAAGMHAIVARECGVAASVDGMPGVLLCDPTPESIAGAMVRSLDQWQGRIQDPPILQHDGAAFADVHLEAVDAVLRRKGRGQAAILPLR
ncbi:MAG: glycosyltransferase family 4 protein [Propionibacteriaceae bacterium]|nr:glycosyltransferase family 4 protein [Propionibacteriaceae bacterium]